MNGGTCLHETLGKRLPSGRKRNVRCNRSSLLTNRLPYKPHSMGSPPRYLRVEPSASSSAIVRWRVEDGRRFSQKFVKLLEF